MKRFLKFVMEWKTAACVLYTGSMAVYLVVCWVFGQDTVTTRLLWMLLLACAAGAFLQAVCFTNWLIKKMSYTLRSALFCVLFLPVLILFAWIGQWFPMENMASWCAFIGVFFAIFFVMLVGFEIYYRLTGRKFDGLLGQYRREKEEKGE